jgi:hypothetical protein
MTSVSPKDQLSPFVVLSMEKIQKFEDKLESFSSKATDTARINVENSERISKLEAKLEGSTENRKNDQVTILFLKQYRDREIIRKR